MKKITKTPVKKAVMEQIKSGKVKMRPRVYFVILSTLSIGAAILAGLALTYLSSVMFFWWRVQSAETMAWGARANLSQVIASFPWWALVVSIVLLIFIALLVRKHGHLYRHRASTIISLVIIVAIMLGFALSLFNVGKKHGPNQHTNRANGHQNCQ
ncbi:MAG: hypothetical protein ACOX0Z_00965 [Candidatus Nanosyncoccaceae bacterium]|jgi:glucan phosphoethanolaminetransferase (alkaline phosphatase superfamily)